MMYPTFPPHVVLFTRPASDTTAKSRLRASENLSDDFVNGLHQRFVYDALSLIAKVESESCMVTFSLEENDSVARELLTELEIQHTLQRGDSFTDRFTQVISTFPEEASVLIIGSDCPALSPAILNEACKAAAKGNVVFGPAQGHGLYLIGGPGALLAQLDWSEIFASSTQGVGLLDSLSKHDSAARHHVLPPLADIDTPEDLLCARSLAELSLTAQEGSVYFGVESAKWLSEELSVQAEPTHPQGWICKSV